MIDDWNLKIVLILTVGFSLAAIFGYVSQRLKLSPIFGYLLAGYAIGPYSPGFVADLKIAEQLAEIGVVLMMFGAGIHFKWQDLMSVKRIAIPGALGQTIIAALICMIMIYKIGWPIEAGIILGLAIGVASTMVLIRGLSDNKLLKTEEGHAAVGWLIVEDIVTVIVLLLLPILAIPSENEKLPLEEVVLATAFALFKCALMVVAVFTIGRKCIKVVLTKAEQMKSEEFFTLTILAVTFAIAMGSTLIFGTSIALGAFIAGMVIRQTKAERLILNKTTPLRDAFVVIFFLSVGMLFNPSVIKTHCYLFLSILAIIILVKPLAAFGISYALRYPIKMCLTVAVALAQIGEFSFILSEEALKLNLIPEDGYDIIVACALVSISMNPIFFKLMKKCEKTLAKNAT